MESQVRPPGVPEDLQKDLHAANARFHESKERLEREMDSTEDSRQQRLDAAGKQLREAEAWVEQATRRINDAIHPPQ